MMLPAAQNTKHTDRHKIGEVGVHARGGERIAHHHEWQSCRMYQETILTSSWVAPVKEKKILLHHSISITQLSYFNLIMLCIPQEMTSWSHWSSFLTSTFISIYEGVSKYTKRSKSPRTRGGKESCKGCNHRHHHHTSCLEIIIRRTQFTQKNSQRTDDDQWPICIQYKRVKL